MAAHALGGHVPHARPLVGVTVEAVGRGGGELRVAAHDEDLAAQHGRRCVAPRLRAFRRDAPAVANGVVALDLRAGWEGVIMTETQFALWLRSLRIRRFS